MIAGAAIAWGAAKRIAGKLPWWAYVAAAVLVAGFIERGNFGERRYEAGRESVLAPLREAEAEAAKRSVEAIAREGKAGAERAAKFDAQQETLSDAIRKAEDANQNALDAIF